MLSQLTPVKLYTDIHINLSYHCLRGYFVAKKTTSNYWLLDVENAITDVVVNIYNIVLESFPHDFDRTKWYNY